MNDSVFLVNSVSDFQVGQPINYFMQAGQRLCRRDPAAFRDASLAIHNEITGILLALGQDVLDIGTLEGGADRVFVRDHVAILGDMAVLARPARATRRGEENGIRPYIKPDHLYELKNPDATFESGDYIPAPFGPGLMGVSSRTNEAAHEELHERFPEEFISLEMVSRHYPGREETAPRARYYHADSALGVTGNGSAAFYPPAFTDKGQKAFRNWAEETKSDVYRLNKFQARRMNANFKTVGADYAITTPLDGDIEQWFVRHAHPFTIKIAPFRAAGAALRCLVHEVPRFMLTPLAVHKMDEQKAARRQALRELERQHPPSGEIIPLQRPAKPPKKAPNVRMVMP